MDYRERYDYWLKNALDADVADELKRMDDSAVEDAFYRDLEFGTGGLRGTIGAGTNRMNVYVVARASQGLSSYLNSGDDVKERSVVIGYDSRIKSDVFAQTAAGVLAANGITVYYWPQLLPVPAVSYAIHYLHASAGIMITASHNPCNYNGYKVYGADGCQITAKAAKNILSRINSLDVFGDVKRMDFNKAAAEGKVKYIAPSVLTAFIGEVKKQSVLFGDPIDRDLAIVYTPLNGTGLVPVTRVLGESGFTNITVVEEQRNPDGNFPTCPYPNPEIAQAMELGLDYAARLNADLLIATDPDCDRCGIAVRAGEEYKLLTGNEVGLLLLDFICSQRVKHNAMPAEPLFVKTIVTTDLAEKIADHYGVKTVNVLTGFKYIGEFIGKTKDKSNFIFGFEESYGYLSGSYVRDKDAVNAAFMICEMFAYYRTRGLSLTDKLNELYASYGYCLNTLHSYEYHGSAGMEKMQSIMADFRKGVSRIAGMKVERVEDYSVGLGGLPVADVLKYFYECVNVRGSVVIRPSGTEPKLKVYISVIAEDTAAAKEAEKQILTDLETRL